MSDLSITASAAGVGIGSAVLMGTVANKVLRSAPALVAGGLIVGSATGALAAAAVDHHAGRAGEGSRAGTSLLSPNVAIPAAVGAGLVGAAVYGTQRLYGSSAATGVLALGAGIIGAAACTAAYNFLKG